MAGKKQPVSIRMGSSDLRNIKRLAKRLGVRDSDVIRYAVKEVLARLEPLVNPEVRGHNLLPVFVESGGDMLRYLELDALRLEDIINEGAVEGLRVDREDIQLLAMSSHAQPYARLRLSSVRTLPRDVAALPESGGSSEPESLTAELRRYLYEKYVYAEQRHEFDSRQTPLEQRRAV